MLKAARPPVRGEVGTLRGPQAGLPEPLSWSKLPSGLLSPSPSHVQGQNPARGLKQAGIFMPRPEKPNLRDRAAASGKEPGGVSGDEEEDGELQRGEGGEPRT